MGIETPATLPDGETPLCLKNMLVKLERIFPRFGVKNKKIFEAPPSTGWMSLIPTIWKSWEFRPDRTYAGLSLFPVLGGWAPLSKKLGSPGDVQSPPKHIVFSFHETFLRSFLLARICKDSNMVRIHTFQNCPKKIQA